MAPPAVESPNKRRRVGSSPIKAQPSLLNFFNNGSSASSATTRGHGEVGSRSESSLQGLEVVDQENAKPSLLSSVSTSKADEVSECPLCSKRVPFNTIQAHVNSCLDAAAAADTKVPEKDLARNNAVSINAASTSLPIAPGSSSAPPEAKADPPAKMTSISELASAIHSSVVPTNDSRPITNLQDGAKPAASAFTVLMKSHSESKQWATADAVEANNYRGRARSKPEARTAPFYKALEGMPLTVDAFRFGKIEGCRGYFLTHFHSDHYGGMTANWNHGPIYCSLTSANLCRTHLGVDSQWLRPLPMEVPVEVPDSGGVTVTCIEANHCPGSCLFLFEGPQTCQLLSRNHVSPYIGKSRIFRYLHCGDFRASPVHTNHPSIVGKKLDIIYLDTTYCNPRYCFPAQDQVIEACAELVRRIMPEDQLERACVKNLDEDEEDWRQAPPRRIRGTVDRDSSTATAFKGWFVGPDGTVTTNDTEDADDKAGVKPDFDREDSVERTVKDEDENMNYDDEDLFEGANTEEIDTEESPAPRVKSEPVEDDIRDYSAKKERTTEDARAGMQMDCSIVKEEEESHTLEVSATKRESPDKEEKKPSTSNWLAKHTESSRDSATTGRRKGRLLVVIGTYTIGKERIVKAVARAMNSKIFCMDSRKYRVYQQLEDPELHSMLTRSPGASVHVTNLHAINGEGLRDVVAALRTRGHDFTHAVAFRPTGWTYKPPAGMDTVSPSLERLIQWNQGRSFGPQHLFPTRDSTPDYMIYGVPYSEHSSFFELTAFALSTNYTRIIATVNVGNPTSRAKMAKWFEKWATEKRRREKLGLHELDARAITYW